MDWAKASQAMVRHEVAEAKAKDQTTTAGPAVRDTPAAAHPPRRRPGIAATPPGPVQPLIGLIGAPIVCHLRYGELVRGVLSRLYHYEIILRTPSGKELVVMKHAIDFAEAADESGDGADG
jgi:hypothetical protein